MSTNRRKIRRIIIKENISLIQKKKALEEKRLVYRKKVYAHVSGKKRHLNEFFGLGGMIGDVIEAGGDSFKQFLIGGLLKMFGAEEGTPFYRIMSNSLENVEFGEVAGLLTGSTTKDDIVEDVIRGISESLIEYAFEKLVEYTNSIPMLSAVIPDPGTLLNSIGKEMIANKITEMITPSIKSTIMNLINSTLGAIFNFFPGGEANNSDFAYAPVSNAAPLNEVFKVAAFRSQQKIRQYNREIKILKNNL